jgi:hypothetical protein
MIEINGIVRGWPNDLCHAMKVITFALATFLLFARSSGSIGPDIYVYMQEIKNK